MLDLRQETLITFEEAAQLLPVDTQPNVSTWWRWARQGIRGRLLETVKVGGRRYTTQEAVLRFVEALTAADPYSPTTPGSAV